MTRLRYLLAQIAIRRALCVIFTLRACNHRDVLVLAKVKNVLGKIQARTNEPLRWGEHGRIFRNRV